MSTKIAIIGAGGMAAYHAKGFREAGAEIVALADLNAAAAEKAAALEPEDIHIHTSLSRIWMERGDKTRAESHGAKARMLGWKEQLKEPPPAAGPRDGLG